MNYVRPKKSLGQHFLKDKNIAEKIVDQLENVKGNILEIGPGTGVLTSILIQRDLDFQAVDVDRESVAYLQKNFPDRASRFLLTDFLKQDISQISNGKFSVIGNFPYNISSQIFFKILDHRNQVTEVVCMIQKEVAERMAAPPGNKTYGILSVLMQAYYNIEYKFTVSEKVFDPPPKVKSAVIRLTRNNTAQLDCDEQLFKIVVKTGFNQRRKILKNSLKSILLNLETNTELLDKRPEQLSVDEFVQLTNLIKQASN